MRRFNSNTSLFSAPPSALSQEAFGLDGSNTTLWHSSIDNSLMVISWCLMIPLLKLSRSLQPLQYLILRNSSDRPLTLVFTSTSLPLMPPFSPTDAVVHNLLLRVRHVTWGEESLQSRQAGEYTRLCQSFFFFWPGPGGAAASFSSPFRGIYFYFFANRPKSVCDEFLTILRTPSEFVMPFLAGKGHLALRTKVNF
jgi:hypothetical protein